MNKITVLQSSFVSPDWAAMQEMDISDAANAIASLLRELDTAEKQVFAARGMALLIVEKHHLWEGHAASMGQWIKHLAPNSWAECYAAMRSIRELLPDVPLEDLQEMKRCNVETIKKLSSAARHDPAVIEAAKVLSREEFEEKIEVEYPFQHIETHKLMHFSPGRSWAKTIENSIAWALEHNIAGDRDEALLRMAETALEQWKLEEELTATPLKGCPA